MDTPETISVEELAPTDTEKAYDRGFEAGLRSRDYEVSEAYEDGSRDGYAEGWEAAERDLMPPKAPLEFAEPFGGETE